MKGDFSRWDVDINKNVNGVLHQQGRVLTDNDWNAGTRIRNDWQEQTGRDTIGPGVAAVPAQEPDSFKVVAAEVVNGTAGEHVELDILPGRVWADGLLTYLATEGDDPAAAVKRTATYLGPPFQDAAVDESGIGADIHDAVILEVWQEALNGFQVPRQLLEPALGGPDTTERVQTAMAFRLLRLEAGDRCEDVADKLKQAAGHQGAIRVTLAPPQTIDGECPVEEGGGYTGFEHHLYRIEMARLEETQLTANGPMFKWSRFNGGLVGQGEFSTAPDKVKISANFQAITTSGLDAFYLEAVEYDEALGHWQVTYGARATLNPDNELDLTGTPYYGSIPASDTTVFFRLWDDIAPISNFPRATSSQKAMTLEDGIRLEFDSDTGDNYNPGDYWTFEVRSGGIANPPTTSPIFSLDPALETDLNSETNSAALQTEFNNNSFAISVNAVVKLETSGQWLISDPDKEESYRVGKEGSLLNVYHLSLLVYGPAEGIRYHRVPLAILDWNAAKKIDASAIRDCRRIFRPLIDQEGCCTYTVGKSGHFATIQKAIEHLPDSGGQICLLPGIYSENVTIHNRDNITITGCDKRTVVMPADPAGRPIFHILDSRCITLEHMDMEAYGGSGVYMEAGAAGQLQEIEVSNNRILACKHAVRVEDGQKIAICGNTIRMLNIEDGDVPIFMEAQNSLIADNDITVVPPEQLPSDIEIPGELPVPDPTDPCADLEIFIHNRPLLGHFLNAIWSFVLTHFPVEPFKTPGGIQIAGSCDSVKILRNHISGGYWNGITLGAIPKALKTKLKTIIKTYAVDSLTPELLERLLKEFAGFIYNLEIAENHIRHMGLNGIGVVSFFNLKQIALMVSVEDLTIYRNTIGDCIRQGPQAFSAEMSRQMALGAISLADCEDLIVRENRIEHNGTTHPGPVCGIFIQHGEKIDISDNRILNNGPESLTGIAAVQGIGGGIVVQWSFKRMVLEAILEKEIFVPDGIPAVKVHDNTVTQPLGQALLLMAMGPVSVVGNHLTSQGVDSRVNSFSMQAGAVFIFNLGVSADLFARLLTASLTSIFQSRLDIDAYSQPADAKAAAGDPSTEQTWAKFLEILLYLPAGDVLFANNQTTLDLRDPEISRPVSSQFIFSFDDISYSSNQTRCNTLFDVLLSDALILGNTVRTNDNRYQEGLTLTFFSLLSFGFMMNTCTSNQATHCMIPTSKLIKPPVFEHNLILIEPFPLNKEATCNSLRECFQIYVNDKQKGLECFSSINVTKIEAIFDQFDTSITLTDQLRLGGMEDLNIVQRVKRDALKKEKVRWVQKYGPQDPRVKNIDAKIHYTDGMTRDLAVMIGEAKTEVKPLDPDTWRIHGKVFDKERQGIQNLTIGLSNSEGNWVKEIGYACTDAKGYFTIDYAIKDGTGKPVSGEEPLFLFIADKDYHVLYRDSDPLFVSPGQMDYRTIRYAGGKDDPVFGPERCPPPEPGHTDIIQPEDQWVVKGRIVDDAGNPMKDLTVSLYDKDHLFDDYLCIRKSDENGTFQFIYRDAGLIVLLAKNPDIYLKVLDSTGQEMYSSRKAIKSTAGGTEVFKIKITRKAKK